MGIWNHSYYKKVLEVLENGLDKNLAIQEQWRQLVRSKFYTLKSDSLLIYKAIGNLCIPNVKFLKLDIMNEVHDSLPRGHFGKKWMGSTILHYFFWHRL
jgi:hypothetical protein